MRNGRSVLAGSIIGAMVAMGALAAVPAGEDARPPPKPQTPKPPPPTDSDSRQVRRAKARAAAKGRAA